MQPVYLEDGCRQSGRGSPSSLGPRRSAIGEGTASLQLQEPAPGLRPRSTAQASGISEGSCE